ncbi:MAG: VWA domain-containing protein [Alicyclobacillus sp.]|nr:VWA domain-containing protein [Alicyclobacillus sp.]
MPEKQAVIRQVLVVTDGCSNVGEDPAVCAARARRRNITVNVIGVVDQGEMGLQGRAEAYSIADAGGGMCRIVEPAVLAQTVQMVTQQTMQLTLQQVVNRELLQVMGKTVEDLPPGERVRILQVVDKLQDEVGLELVVAIDTSASMREKMAAVRAAIHDLALSLQVRQGPALVAVLAFPGEGEAAVRLVQPFQVGVNVTALEQVFVARGGTPTGPAILEALALFEQSDVGRSDEGRWIQRAEESFGG